MTRMPRRIEAGAHRRISSRVGASAHGLRPTSAAVVAAAVHVAAFVVALAIEPEPTNAEVAWEWLSELVTLAYIGALGTAFATVRSPGTSLAASSLAGVVAVGITLACPATGHHELAGWWYGQLAVFGAATVTPLYLVRRLRR